MQFPKQSVPVIRGINTITSTETGINPSRIRKPKRPIRPPKPRPRPINKPDRRPDDEGSSTSDRWRDFGQNMGESLLDGEINRQFDSMAAKSNYESAMNSCLAHCEEGYALPAGFELTASQKTAIQKECETKCLSEVGYGPS